MGESHESNRRALQALRLTEEELLLTSNIAFRPPPNVFLLQVDMCALGDPLGVYFSHAIHETEPSCRRATEEAIENIHSNNEDISNVTMDYSESPGIDDYMYYIFPLERLKRLLPVAKRAWYLLFFAVEPLNDYLQLRDAVLEFTRKFKYPDIFRNVLGFSSETVPRTLEPGAIWRPRVVHKRREMELIGLFSQMSVQGGAYLEAGGMLLLKPASQNPMDSEYALEPQSKFPGMMEVWLRNHEATEIGEISRWNGKISSDFIITGFANGPIPLILAKSRNGDINEGWFLAKECIKKFGAPQLNPMIWRYRRTTGAILMF
jgi:hypothetical protein